MACFRLSYKKDKPTFSYSSSAAAVPGAVEGFKLMTTTTLKTPPIRAALRTKKTMTRMRKSVLPTLRIVRKNPKTLIQARKQKPAF